MKKDLSENEPVGDKHQPLESMVEEDNRTALSENTSLSSSSISRLVRLRRKLRFQEDIGTSKEKDFVY